MSNAPALPLSSDLEVPVTSTELSPPPQLPLPGNLGAVLRGNMDPNVLRRMYERSLLRKYALVAALADAEQQCQNWEGALRQMLGEDEVNKISCQNLVVDVDEVDTVKGQYTIAVAGIRMRDFAFNRFGHS